MISNNDLKKASQNFNTKKAELYNDILQSVSKETKYKKIPLRPIRQLAAVLIALSIIFVGTLTTYGVSPTFRNYLNLWFSDSQKTNTVPEGYTAINSIEDLNNIRNRLNGNYILMKDLTFNKKDFAKGGAFEGGWLSIGDEVNAFTGIFDGNGHIISNLTFNGTQKNIGLFGIVVSVAQRKSDFDYSNNTVYDKETKYSGVIKNLGLENACVNIDMNVMQYSNYNYIGTVAAYGNYIVNCYSENVKITLKTVNEQLIEDNANNQESLYSFEIGGLCGKAFIIDSCYSSAEINISNKNRFIEVWAGGLSSFSNIATTSYFTGSITENGIKRSIDSVLEFNYCIPNLLSKERLENLVSAITATSDNSRDAKQFNAFYVLHYLSQREKDLLRNDADYSKQYYIIEPQATRREFSRLQTILLKAFSEQEIRQGTFNEGIKDNINACFILEANKNYEQSYFKDFDFENIWVMKDGVPKLKIFD